MARAIWLPGGGGADLDVITATAADVVAPKVIVDQNGEPVTGTMPDRGNWSSAELAAGASVTIPAGKHGGAGEVTAKSLASQTPGNLAAANMIAGTYGVSNGLRVDGNMPDYRTSATHIGNRRLANGRVEVAVARGAHAESWNYPEYMSYAEARSLIGLSSANMLRKGVNILGLTGTFQGYVDSPLYLYNKGVWSNLQTTGMTLTTGHRGSQPAYLSMGGTYYEVSGVYWDNSPALARLNQTINLTSYNYVCIRIHNQKFTQYGSGYVGISKNSQLGSASFDASVSSIKDTGLIKIPIHSISGDYFIYWGLTNSGGDYASMPINEVFLSTT